MRTHSAIMKHKENLCAALRSEFAVRPWPLFVLKVLDLVMKGMEQFCSSAFRNLKMGWSHSPRGKLFITWGVSLNFILQMFKLTSVYIKWNDWSFILFVLADFLLCTYRTASKREMWPQYDTWSHFSRCDVAAGSWLWILETKGSESSCLLFST